MKMTKADRVAALVNQTGGKFFTVHFTKANGEPRVMNCRTGVKKHLKGGESTYNGKNNDRHNIGVYESNNSYRCFSADRVTKLVIDKMEIEFND